MSSEKISFIKSKCETMASIVVGGLEFGWVHFSGEKCRDRFMEVFAEVCQPTYSELPIHVQDRAERDEALEKLGRYTNQLIHAERRVRDLEGEKHKEFTFAALVKEVEPKTEFEYSGRRYVMLDQKDVAKPKDEEEGIWVFDLSGRCISIFANNTEVKVVDVTAKEEPKRDTSDAGLTEILTEDKLVNERIEQELQKAAQERECELRELTRLLKVGIIQRKIEHMGMCCDPATGKLLALRFLRVEDDQTIWIAPGDDFDMVFERLHRIPSDAEFAKVKEEAESLGCTYGGWGADKTHLIIDSEKSQANFFVVPGRPVIDALRECWDTYDLTLAETKPVTEHG